jgi:hypothetical protein
VAEMGANPETEGFRHAQEPVTERRAVEFCQCEKLKIGFEPVFELSSGEFPSFVSAFFGGYQ